MATPIPLGALHLVGLEELRKRWGWFVALGELLMLLGVVTMVFIGWLMIAGGVLEILYAGTRAGVSPWLN